MKLVRYGAKGAEKPGILVDGQIRDLSAHVSDITVTTIADVAVDVASLPVVEGDVRYGVPVSGIGKIVAIGLNYRDHAIDRTCPSRPSR
jgi:2-keto-4-pentenoate hydratase/2-oxohepta-3-ene-1,7-dioic acid hydratase in catechol pathway